MTSLSVFKMAIVDVIITLMVALQGNVTSVILGLQKRYTRYLFEL